MHYAGESVNVRIVPWDGLVLRASAKTGRVRVPCRNSDLLSTIVEVLQSAEPRRVIRLCMRIASSWSRFGVAGVSACVHMFMESRASVVVLPS